jgi:SAM-dependent methyltransferase
MHLNLGCGTHVVDGWVNVDFAPGARLAQLPAFAALNRRLRLFNLPWSPGILIHDLRRPFPWADGSVRAVYSSHTLEHLTREEGRRFLKDCHRVLHSGGIIRLVVPDLRAHVREYLDGSVRADTFVERLGVLYGNTGSRLKDRLAPLFQFPHRCMYDESGLLELLRQTGFRAASRRPFESDLEDIGRLELPERTRDAVIVEGRKEGDERPG